jgi:hypothetical protein
MAQIEVWCIDINSGLIYVSVKFSDNDSLLVQANSSE